MSSVSSRREGKVLIVSVSGDAGTAEAEQLLARFGEAEGPDTEEVVVELSDAEHLGTAMVAALALGGKRLPDKRHVIRGARPEHVQALALVKAPEPTDKDGDESRVTRLEAIGAAGFRGLHNLAELGRLLGGVATAGYDVLRRRAKFPFALTVQQAVVMGVSAFPIIGLLSLLLGTIMAFQAAYQLRQFGANIYIADLVSISMVREFGPMMTAIILAGRSGSAIAAELGTMKVQEEIDALRTMGIAPARVLILPRLLSLIMVQPMLTLLAIYVGILGGLITAVPALDLSPDMYLSRSIQVLTPGDLAWGLSKSVVFAALIGLIGCSAGLKTTGGAQAVGHSTTRAVVSSIFLIIVTDGVFAIVNTLVKSGDIG